MRSFSLLVLALFAGAATAIKTPTGGQGLMPHANPAGTAPMVRVPEAPKKAPKSGWTLTTGGGVRTREDVYAARDKARKAYEKGTMGGYGESDISRVEKGWTTK